MVPDQAGALFAKYTFRGGRGKGLGLSFGLHHVGVLPGDTATGVTPAGVPNQPSFYLAARTILQAGISYQGPRWSLGVVMDNLADKDYIQSSSSRSNLLPGEPRNCSVTLAVKW
jgi:iron complex outermembrane receptor protein